MRSISAFVALSFVAGVSGIKGWYSGELFSDPTQKPALNVTTVTGTTGGTFSYYPNPFQCTNVADCGCGDVGEPQCGPLNWAYVNADTLQTCLPDTGGQQTPINLDAFEDGYKALNKAEGRMKFTGGKCTGLIEKMKGTYEIVFFDECDETPKPLTVTVDGETWNLWQMHVHAPSEHTVNGIYYPVEIHLVHVPDEPENAENALVLGMFLTQGKGNSFFDILTAQDADLGTERRKLSEGEEVRMVKAANPYSLIPQDKAYWHYQGSLTAIGYGGCQLNGGETFDSDKNNIQWYVFKNPQTASFSQLAWLTDYLCELPLPYLCQSNRPLQEILPDTEIYKYGKMLK